MRGKNGKSSPAMINEDESVRIFDRQNRNSNIAKQAIFGPDLSVRREISQSFQILIVTPAKAGGQGQPPQCLGSLGSVFAKYEFNQLIWFIFLGLPRKCYSSRVKSERSVKKLDTPPPTIGLRGSCHWAFAANIRSRPRRLSGGSGCRAIEERSRPLPGQLIRVQLRFNSCISFSASALSANEPKEPSRFSSRIRASAARPTR